MNRHIVLYYLATLIVLCVAITTTYVHAKENDDFTKKKHQKEKKRKYLEKYGNHLKGSVNPSRTKASMELRRQDQFNKLLVRRDAALDKLPGTCLMLGT